MASPTNLTDRIAKLREKKSHSSVLNAPEGSNDRLNSSVGSRKAALMDCSRKLAFDYFTQFAYSLLFIALVGQLLLIVSLELI